MQPSHSFVADIYLDDGNVSPEVVNVIEDKSVRLTCNTSNDGEGLFYTWLSEDGELAVDGPLLEITSVKVIIGFLK